jgi:anti-sigma regulatory factor (Ser/Thr protein kinase)
MRDLSLHILDLVENSIRAEATTVWVTVAEDEREDLLTIVVEDNGPGLNVPPEVALNPFYTTKEGKRVGLGLSLFQEAAEQAGGRLTLGRSKLGGLAVEAVMKLRHIDRPPLGDVAAVISAVVCTNPNLNLGCTLRAGDQENTTRVSDTVREFCDDPCCGLLAARKVSERIKRALAALPMTA